MQIIVKKAQAIIIEFYMPFMLWAKVFTIINILKIDFKLFLLYNRIQ